MDDHLPPEKVSTIIVSRPGVIRHVLRTMLAMLPQIEFTGEAGGGLSALNMVCQNRPGLLIIDSSLPQDETLALLQQIKHEQPHIRCLVVAETARQHRPLLAGGADAVILRSDPTERMVEVLNSFGLW